MILGFITWGDAAVVVALVVFVSVLLAVLCNFAIIAWEEAVKAAHRRKRGRHR